MPSYWEDSHYLWLFFQSRKAKETLTFESITLVSVCTVYDANSLVIQCLLVELVVYYLYSQLVPQ